MKIRKKPTSVLFNERNRLASDLYRACADGKIKDIKKLKQQFNKSCEEYNKRLIEEEVLRNEKAQRAQRKRRREV